MTELVTIGGAFKTCACGRSFTRAEWAALVFRGIQQIGEKFAELRDCNCGSTIATEVERRLGATDISAVVGLNTYANARDVFDRIVLGKEKTKTPAMGRGLKVEPLIREHGVNHYGLKLEPHPGIIRHKTHDFATASPDDWCEYEGVRCVVDYKTCSVWTLKAHPEKWGDDGSDHVPEQYAIQMAWNMALADMQRALLLVAFGEDFKDDAGEQQFDIKYFRLYRLWREPQIEAALFVAGEKFWREHVLTGVASDMRPQEEILKEQKRAKDKAKREAKKEAK